MICNWCFKAVRPEGGFCPLCKMPPGWSDDDIAFHVTTDGSLPGGATIEICNWCFKAVRPEGGFCPLCKMPLVMAP
jgi:hypothetical protein